MLKVLYVQPYLTFGEVLFDTLPGQLAERGHEIIIVSHMKKKLTVLSSNRKNLTIHPIVAVSLSIPYLMADFPYFVDFGSYIKKIKPDVLHVNNLPFLTTYQSVILAKKLGIPSVIQVHGVTADRGFILNSFQWLFLKVFGKKVFDSVTNVICLTQADARQIQKFGCPIDKICIIPNGVDINKFKPSSEHEQEGLVIWIGRFVKEKGLEFLIKAVDILVKNGKSDFRLLLIGDGPIKSKIYSQIRSYGLERYIQLMPAISHDEVSDYMARASIFVFPSIKEGMPYVLLEAMACGKAIVGSDISGVNSIINDNENGLLVPAKDPVSLSAAISRLLKDKKLRSGLGQSARQSTVIYYDWHGITSEIERLYSNIKNSLLV